MEPEEDEVEVGGEEGEVWANPQGRRIARKGRATSCATRYVIKGLTFLNVRQLFAVPTSHSHFKPGFPLTARSRRGVGGPHSAKRRPSEPSFSRPEADVGNAVGSESCSS